MNKRITVVVALTDKNLLSDYVLSSPGLKELDVQIITIKGAASAAEAFYQGISKTDCPWIIYCHQDVYFPEGSGHEIERILSKVEKSEETKTVIGFFGITGDLNSENVAAIGKVTSGLLGTVDRSQNTSKSIIAMDELAVVMYRDCKYKIDPKLGWHLWATDLCLQAALEGVHLRVESLLLEHYSAHDYVGNGGCPPEYWNSEKVLADKYLQLDIIRSVCSTYIRRQAPQSLILPKRPLRRPPRLGFDGRPR